ncbi:MAG: sigma 54 modulation/S30EA ribosomal C-terminal domain-containing protein [Bacilli bacterium]|nr:sigma 54 modulation/S30EA ribosomal C-terminal domain-containing protein [Bacilli bacterium]
MQAELMANSLVKDKKIDLVPMTVDEALMQMDLLDHKFFIFLNSETNKVCVVYLREDHDYGIIETNM